MKFAAVRLKKKKDGKFHRSKLLRNFFNKEERRSYKISRASYPVQLRGCSLGCHCNLPNLAAEVVCMVGMLLEAKGDGRQRPPCNNSTAAGH